MLLRWKSWNRYLGNLFFEGNALFLFWPHSNICIIRLQELIRNKARNSQNCTLLEQAYAIVSALTRRAENNLHVSLIENYPGTLESLGEPIRQVTGISQSVLRWASYLLGLVVSPLLHGNQSSTKQGCKAKLQQSWEHLVEFSCPHLVIQ